MMKSAEGIRVEPVSYEQIDAFIERLVMVAEEKENLPERQELEAIIRQGGGLLIGAKALARYLKPRFTEDTDYLVDGRTFQKVRSWFREHKDRIQCEDEGEAITCDMLGIDIVDARNHPVLIEIVRRESIVPSAEALAAMKYCSAINPARTRRDQDAVDFRSLVKVPGFDDAKCLGYFVDRFESLRGEVAAAIEKIRKGDPGVAI
jgi:hypothetical protein